MSLWPRFAAAPAELSIKPDLSPPYSRVIKECATQAHAY
jgi:hypothetical protein